MNSGRVSLALTQKKGFDWALVPIESEGERQMTPSRRRGPTGQGHPSGDERYKAIDRTMKMSQYEPDSLLEVLNSAQEAFGYLTEDLLIYISSNLQVPMSRVYGVATFYHMFSFEPLGENNCIICTGTACHVKGSQEIVNALAGEFDVEQGGTTADGVLSLTTARCLGSCGLAPVMVLNGQVIGKSTPGSASRQVHEVLETSRPTVEAG
jgi:bidirectional [NiFe] hydrogenase diaphorase subunit